MAHNSNFSTHFCEFYPNGNLFIEPLNENRDFAFGLSEMSKTARLAEFDPIVHQLKDLQHFMQAKLLQFNFILMGKATDGVSCTLQLFMEILRLKWPLQWMKKVAKAVPIRHNSPYIRMVQKMLTFMAKRRNIIDRGSQEEQWTQLCTYLDFNLHKAVQHTTHIRPWEHH